MLIRDALVPIPITPQNLAQTTFSTDGATFGLAGIPLTLAIGTFQGNTSNFTLTIGRFMASGQVIIGSCTFVIAASMFSPSQGTQVGDCLTMDPSHPDAPVYGSGVSNAPARLA